MKFINCFTLSIYLFFTFVSTANSATTKSTHNENDQAIINVTFSGFNELHIIGADRDNDKNLRWAVWNQASSQDMMVVKLALVEKSTKGPVVHYTLERKDAYDSDINRIVEWHYGKHPVLAFTYHMGAAAQQLELYGIDDNNQPVQLDERLGEVIGWVIDSQGRTLLGVYTKPEGRLSPTWYRWDEKSHSLIENDNTEIR